MGRGGTLTVLVDTTPLNGPTIDVASRIGWLTRTSRLVSRVPVGRLEDMARAVGTNVTRVHRLETGRQRDGGLLDAYEQVLDRQVGSLRAPIDIACRTFPGSPVDRNPASALKTVAELSALTERLLDVDDAVTGGDWLLWARALARPGAIGLPTRLARQLVLRLAGEMARSAGPGYPTRYEALALLRGGPYGEVVLSVAQEIVADPDVQVLNDLMSAVGETITPEAVAWCLDLLHDPRPRVVVGAVLALENMGQIALDDGFWEPLVGRLVAAYDSSEGDGEAWRWLSHLLRLVPPAARHRVRPGRPLAPAATVESWSQGRTNRHWTDCQRRAKLVTDEVGLPEQPMLARLLFDIAISPHESRAVTSYMLLGALPDVAVAVGGQVADLFETSDDPVVRDRAGHRLAGTLHGSHHPVIEDWLTPDSPHLGSALAVTGAAGRAAPEALLRSCLPAGGPLARRALYAAAMSGSPALTQARDDESLDAEVRGGAAWWLRHGGRVVD